jgi:hypothetical protein
MRQPVGDTSVTVVEGGSSTTSTGHERGRRRDRRGRLPGLHRHRGDVQRRGQLAPRCAAGSPDCYPAHDSRSERRRESPPSAAGKSIEVSSEVSKRLVLQSTRSVGRLLGDHVGRHHCDQFGRLNSAQVAHPVTATEELTRPR